MRNSLPVFAVALALSVVVAWSARAQDVVVTPGAGGGFVVKDSSGTTDRLRVTEAEGDVWHDGHRFLHGTGFQSGENLFLGVDAGNPTHGSQNVCVGYSSMSDPGNGIKNAALGANSLRSNTSGSNNVAVGFAALTTNTVGNENTAVGASALSIGPGAGSNVAVGAYSLQNLVSGSSNVGVGHGALRNAAGDDATAVGKSALQNATSGGQTAVGFEALKSVSSGSGNTALGFLALRDATGSSNTAIGGAAMVQVGAADENVAVGGDTLQLLQSGSGNVAIGNSSLSNMTSGTENIAIGYHSGLALGSANFNHNILIGSQGMGFDQGQIRLGDPAQHTDTHLVGKVHVGYERVTASTTLATPTVCTYGPSSFNCLVGEVSAVCPGDKVVIGGGCDCGPEGATCSGGPAIISFEYSCNGAARLAGQQMLAIAICARLGGLP